PPRCNSPLYFERLAVPAKIPGPPITRGDVRDTLRMPIKFEIYRDGQRLSSFTPVNAIAMGPESVPIPGDVVFRDGLLVVSRTDEHAAGVSLLWDMGPVGSYQMETTRVLPRDRTYVLNVELARARLMKIIQKQEDWNL